MSSECITNTSMAGPCTRFGKALILILRASGFHQSRWGYKNADELIDVRDQYQKNDLPLDTIWTDIDYMINKTNFLLD